MQPLSWVSCDPVPESERVELGYVNGVFGVRGEVRLYLHNREADWLGRPRAVLVESDEGRCYSVRLRTRRGAGKRILGRLDGVETREQAAALSGWRVVVRASELPRTAPGEFYVRDVLGLPVVVDGAVVGELTEVHRGGPLDILEIQLEGGDAVFVPTMREYVLQVGPELVELAPEALGGDE